MAETFGGTLLPQNQTIEEMQKSVLDLLAKINTVSQSAGDAIAAVQKTIPSPYSVPQWQPYPAGTYVFPSGNQTVAAGVLAIGADTTAPNKATTNTSYAYYRDWGAAIDIMYLYQHTSNVGAASGTGSYLISLPLGKTFNSSIVISATNYMGTKLTPGNIIMDTGTFFSGVLEPCAYNTNCIIFMTTYASSSGSANAQSWSSANFNMALAVTRYCVSGTILGIPVL